MRNDSLIVSVSRFIWGFINHVALSELFGCWIHHEGLCDGRSWLAKTAWISASTWLRALSTDRSMLYLCLVCCRTIASLSLHSCVNIGSWRCCGGLERWHFLYYRDSSLESRGWLLTQRRIWSVRWAALSWWTMTSWWASICRWVSTDWWGTYPGATDRLASVYDFDLWVSLDRWLNARRSGSLYSLWWSSQRRSSSSTVLILVSCVVGRSWSLK